MPRRVRPPSTVPVLPLGITLTSPQPPGTELDIETEVATAAFSAANVHARRAMKADDEQDPWHDSEFKWLRSLPTPRRGKAGVLLAETVIRGAGYDVRAKSSPGHEWVVNGHKVRVKFSTLWATGSYTFQQLPASGFDVLVLLGVGPYEAHAWCAPAHDVRDHIVSDKALGLEVEPDAPPAWLRGGPLTAFFKHIPELLGAPDAPHGPSSITKHAAAQRRRTT